MDQLFVVNRYDENTEASTIDEKSNIDRLLKQFEAKKKEPKENSKKRKLEYDSVHDGESDKVPETEQKNKRKRLSSSETIDEVKCDDVSNVINHTDGTNEINDDATTTPNNGKKNKKRKPKKKNIVNSEEQMNGVISNTEVKEGSQEDKVINETNSSTAEEFTILGNNKFDKKTKVKRILPKWLLNPIKISTSLQNLETKVSSVKDLDKDLRKQLKNNNIKHFFPVQASVIPWLLRSIKQSSMIIPGDICVSAPTGSGKTLAFVLPVVQALKLYHVKKIRALVILPTQDLAVQVYKTFKTYVDGTHLDVGLITGNCAFEKEDPENEGNFGLCNDILVCTPGRLVDYLKETNSLDLQHLKFLVIDEADRIMDNMQNNWLYHLENQMKKNSNNLQSTKIFNLLTMKHRPVQKLLFSATLSVDPEKLQQLSLFQPKLFTCVDESNCSSQDNNDSYIGKYTLPSELTEKYIQCDVNLKPLVVYKFIKDSQLNRIIIFTHSAETAQRLAVLLQDLFKKELKVHFFGKLEANHRARLIKDFANGIVNVIVCTDSLARGIDLPNVQCVISYSIPKFLKNYIHRVGRTARAGESGLAVTVVDTDTKLTKLTSLFKEKKSLEEVIIPEESLQLLERRYSKALGTLKHIATKNKAEDFRKNMSAKKRVTKKFYNSTK